MVIFINFLRSHQFVYCVWRYHPGRQLILQEFSSGIQIKHYMEIQYDKINIINRCSRNKHQTDCHHSCFTIYSRSKVNPQTTTCNISGCNNSIYIPPCDLITLQFPSHCPTPTPCRQTSPLVKHLSEMKEGWSSPLLGGGYLCCKGGPRTVSYVDTSQTICPWFDREMYDLFTELWP